jgi:hypothetical protein
MGGRRALRWVAIWTSVWLIVLAVYAFQTLGSLYVAGQRCFIDAPPVPCPDAGAGAITVGFVAIPLVWLAGILVYALVASRRRGENPPAR